MPAAGMNRVVRRSRVLRVVVATDNRGGSLDEGALDRARVELERIEVGGPDPDRQSGIGAVLLISQGRNFCTGGDVSAFSAADDPAVEVARQATALHAFLRAMVAAPVPVVAAVNGWAAGAGMSLVCHCDLAVAGESTRMRPGYPPIGFSPDGGLSWTLPRMVGAGTARHILYTDAVIDAAQALRLGLVSSVVPDQEVSGTADRLATELAAGPTGAYGRIKRLLADSPGRDLAGQLDAEVAAVAAGASTAEGREGVAAFLQRRPPSFHPD